MAEPKGRAGTTTAFNNAHLSSKDNLAEIARKRSLVKTFGTVQGTAEFFQEGQVTVSENGKKNAEAFYKLLRPFEVCCEAPVFLPPVADCAAREHGHLKDASDAPGLGDRDFRGCRGCHSSPSPAIDSIAIPAVSINVKTVRVAPSAAGITVGAASVCHTNWSARGSALGPRVKVPTATLQNFAATVLSKAFVFNSEEPTDPHPLTDLSELTGSLLGCPRGNPSAWLPK